MDLTSSDIATAGLGSRCRGFVSGPKVCHKFSMRSAKLTTVELVVVGVPALSEDNATRHAARAQGLDVHWPRTALTLALCVTI